MGTAVSHANLPGPRTLPFVGLPMSMIRLFQDTFPFLLDLHSRYGNIVALSRGRSVYVCAFGPELNFQILSQPDLFEVSAGPFTETKKETPLMRVGGNSLQVMKGEKHRQQRRLMQPAFHRQHIGQYCDDMVYFTLRMLENWRGRSEIHLFREMELLTMNVVVKTLFGLDDEEEIRRLGTLLERLVAAVTLAVALPLNIPGTPYYQTQRLAEQLEVMLKTMIAQKRMQSDVDDDLLALLIRQHDEDGTTLQDKELISHAFTLFTAGHSTTSAALTWTIFLLSQHPQIYANLLDELEGILKGEPPTVEQLKQLSYLDWVIKESLRLLPPGAIGMRKATASCELGGYMLPEGSVVIYSEFVTQRLPELYEEPDRFQPERWATLKRTAYEYLPFSAGQHRCIGADFAIQESKIVLATLLQRCRLECLPGTKINLDLTMKPKYGLPMRIFPPNRQMKYVPVRGNIQQLIQFQK